MPTTNGSGAFGAQEQPKDAEQKNTAENNAGAGNRQNSINNGISSGEIEARRAAARQQVVRRYTNSRADGQFTGGFGDNHARDERRDIVINIPTFVIVLAFIFCWPVGVALIVLKHVFPQIINTSQRREMPRPAARPQQNSQYTRNAQHERVREYERIRTDERRRIKKEQIKRRRGTSALRFWGGTIALLGAFSAFMSLSRGIDFSAFVVFSGMFAGGCAMVSAARNRRRLENRHEMYLSVLGGRPYMSIADISGSMGVSQSVAKRDLLRMVELGYLRGAFYDSRSKCFVMPGNEAPFVGAPEEPAEKEQEGARMPPPPPQPKPETVGSENTRVIAQIRSLNDRINDEAVSIKIDRIETITATIFDIVEQKPEKKQQIRGFMNYYLPTTLKILDAYARYEAQSVRGKNIDTAAKSIEGILDKLVSAFENQLDRLFMDDVLDISTEIDVLESMLAKDGLSAGPLTMPGTDNTDY